ncbi:ABC-three component system protein [Streptomyces sp. I05A-00742]|uniref:ABC-three component system protein n=1 Tax=Streptomyces sp. I05A-00742 TaxID=2732853 RepID=UPI0014878670|nr:ABC-three component system protein [Streptomyces sp. I05A-00742]
MDFTQRMLARLTLRSQLTDMPGERFEQLIHHLLSLVHPDFVAVRTHGNLGDMGADGLLLWQRELWACYSPQTENMSKVKAKFRSDLDKALGKRSDTFDTFRFAINDLRGVHPELSMLMSEAQEKLRPRRVLPYGWHHLWADVLKLDQVAAEDLLGCELPVQAKTYGIGLTDLEALLAQLCQQRHTAEPLAAIPDVNKYKLEWNRLMGDVRGALIQGIKHSHLVQDYYAGLAVPDEADQVAQGFRVYYDQARGRTDDQEKLWSALQEYILGNANPSLSSMYCAWIVIAYFFQRRDVFDVPPDGWVPDMTGRSST